MRAYILLVLGILGIESVSMVAVKHNSLDSLAEEVC